MSKRAPQTTREQRLEEALVGLLRWFGPDCSGRPWKPFAQVYMGRLLVGLDTLPQEGTDNAE